MPVHVPCHVTQFKFKETISVLPFIFFFPFFHSMAIQIFFVHTARCTAHLPPAHTQTSICSERAMWFPKSFGCYSLFVSFVFFPLLRAFYGCLFSFLCRFKKKKQIFRDRRCERDRMQNITVHKKLLHSRRNLSILFYETYSKRCKQKRRAVTQKICVHISHMYVTCVTCVSNHCDLQCDVMYDTFLNHKIHQNMFCCRTQNTECNTLFYFFFVV